MSRHNPLTIRELAVNIAHSAGMRRDEAAILSDSLVEADLQGASSHGVSRLNIYIRRIQEELIDPQAELIVERKGGSALVVDAANGLGQVQAWKTLDMLIPMAKNTGVAAATIKNSQHFGALSFFCNRAAGEDMILLATSNAEPSMSPAGGYQSYFGTNPIAVSFPTGKGYPVKIDLSTSVVARGKIIAAHKRGEDIPAGWALDEGGNPTTDAERALMGTVLTMAGHKGYALALMVEVLSGVLSGSAFGSSVGSMYKDMDRKQDVGHFFCLLNIGAFMEVPLFKKRIDRMIDEIKSGGRQPGVDEILVPGERSFLKVKENIDKGIEIGDETIEELKTLCEEFNIRFDLDRGQVQ